MNPLKTRKRSRNTKGSGEIGWICIVCVFVNQCWNLSRCVLVPKASWALVVEPVFQTLSDNPFIKNFVQKCVEREANDHIKEKALRCYALLSLVSLCSVGDAFKFFIEKMKPGCFPEELWLVAMQAIFDILLWYGQKIMEKECQLRNVCFIIMIRSFWAPTLIIRRRL